MFDTIILLTGAVEQGPLSALLCAHNPELVVHSASTRDDLAAFDPATLGRARLIAFSSPVIVQPDLLGALGYGAYNFHPGPPQYPGWAPAHFALYEKAREFGVTVHLMAERVDSGPIVETALFQVPAEISVLGLEGLAYAHLAQLFWRLSKKLATDASALPAGPLHWSSKKNSRRGYRAICDIPLDISKEELDRRMRIFGANHYGMTPTINLHGIEFRAVAN
ncbi:MAG: methionyl-tRNA formyltransferase [Bradyrhizobium sp.]|uniref:formyltransferase family protein n=1 Tax=Bradyrhizobium sp. TaxID=376 RepID=UPI001DA9C579|nr:formyltransferase family protein [Bradyrhizobium sp.]MBV9565989.1 methionyl-tRNA formyltransferase [Bradyrhizobium sp.]